MTMVSLILIPIIFGVILYKVPIKIGKVILMFIQSYLSVTAISLLVKSRTAGTITEVLGGDNPILYISLRADNIALAFVCLTIFLFTTTFIYTLKGEYFDNRFMLLFLVLQGLLTGIFLTDDLFNLFVLMEVSTVIVTILIMYKKDNRRVIYDGLYYLIIQIISMMFFLFGIAYIYKIFGVLSLAEISNLMAIGVPKETLILPFSFLMTGLCLKIGFFPLFSWVSRAYGTPSTPFAVLAILSGLVAKSSLFQFIRLNRLFYPTLDYTNFFLVLAILTGIIGFMKALAQKDIKLILAYSTISQIGLIIIGSLMLDEKAYWGSMYHIINHSLFKALLFLTTGIITEVYGTRNVHKIRGVFKRMPVVAGATILAILGITGAPFFNGAVSKYWILEGSSGTIFEAIIWIINTGTILVFVKYGAILFGTSEAKEKKSTDIFRTSVIWLLGIVCLLGGIFGPQVVHFLFGVELSINMLDFMSKGLIYIAMLLGAHYFYRYVLMKTNLLYRFAEGSLTLPQNCLVLLIFFMTLISYGIFLA